MDASRHIGMAAAIAAGVVWGFLGLAVRELQAAGFTVMQMTCFRYVVVVVIFGAFIAVHNRSLLKIDRRLLLILLAMGILGTMLNSMLYFGSMERISLSLSTVLQYLSPFIVVALSIPLLHERFTMVKGVALAVAFLGCVFCTGVLTNDTPMDVIGIALGAASGFCYALYTLYSKKIRSEGCSVTTIMFYTGLFCAVALLPFSDLPRAGELLMDPGNLLTVVCLGVFLTLLPFGLYNYALGRVEAGKVAIVTYVEPVAATVVGLAFYGEEVTLGIVIGIALILVALALVNRPGADEVPA
ncbi:MAG: EamA family transporter [archaeon]|nr:EamA family transporter [archaeon]